MRIPRRYLLTPGPASTGAEMTLYAPGFGDAPRNPVDDAKIKFGLGGLAAGLFAGWLFGSRYTVHAPVRRRISLACWPALVDVDGRAPLCVT